MAEEGSADPQALEADAVKALAEARASLEETQAKLQAVEKERAAEQEVSKKAIASERNAVKRLKKELKDGADAAKAASAEATKARTTLEELLAGAKKREEQVRDEAEAAARAHAEASSSWDARAAELERKVEEAESKGKGELEELASLGSDALAKEPRAKGQREPTFSENLSKGLALKLMQVEEELFVKSAELVAEAEKVLQLKGKLGDVKAKYATAASDVSTARATLLKGIVGPEVDESKYKHVAIDELVRLRLRKEGADTTNQIPFSSASSSTPAPAAAAAAAAADAKTAGAGDAYDADDFEGEDGDAAADGGGGGGTQVEGQLRLEKECAGLRAKNKRLAAKLKGMQERLSSMDQAVNDVRMLKDKTHELAGRQRQEKELRQRFESAAKTANEKVVALSEHIEKLMVHLKHEAAAKAKINDLQRRTEKEVALLKQRNAALGRKTKGRERAVTELKEGTKILEDQLRLMDQKYVELRAKLDWTRASSAKEVKRVTAEANQLRAKWALVVDSGAVPAAEADLFAIDGPGGKGKGKRKGRKKKKGGASASAAEGEQGGDDGGMPPIGSNQKEGGNDASMPWSDKQTRDIQIG